MSFIRSQISKWIIIEEIQMNVVVIVLGFGNILVFNGGRAS